MISFVVPGPVNIFVKGGAHMSGYPIADISELGLSVEDVKVTYHFFSEDVRITGLGNHVPGDVQTALAMADISAKLICLDPAVLGVVVDESLAGGGLKDLISRAPDPFNVPFDTSATASGGMAGILPAAGTLMGKRLAMHDSGCRYFSVSLVAGEERFALAAGTNVSFASYRFLKCQLHQRPLVTKLGAKVLEAEVLFRALPYADPYRSGLYSGQAFADLDEPNIITRSGAFWVRRREILMSGAVLWDRVVDELPEPAG
jgi:hypothetical protein